MKKCVVVIAVLLIFVSLQGFASGKRDERKLEIFNWLTDGAGADGLEALFKIYSQRYPDVKIINTGAAGEAGQNAGDVLAARMQAGKPPDTFQVHAGHEFIDMWVVSGKMEPITFILKDNGWLSLYPKGLIDIISHQGEVYCIPVNIHRSNVLWYNKAIFSANSITPPVSMADFFAAAEKLADAGITPLAMGDKDIRAATHLLESVLLGSLGPVKYNGLWNGKTAWDSADVKNAFTGFMKILKYVNSDHAVLSWEQAAQCIIDGKCAMTIMGDWINGYFTIKGLVPDREYGWIASPGTGGSFLMLSDVSFGLPKGAPHRDQAIMWLTVCASREGQDAFNPFKGSIPGRRDGDRNLYDAYRQSAMADFSSNVIVPGAADGAAAAEGWVTKIDDVVSKFITGQDVETAVKELAEAARLFIK
jgi:glucose/mannose transport system substrate-binding protein